MAMESLQSDFALKGHFRINILKLSTKCHKSLTYWLFWYVNSRFAVKNTFVPQLLLNLVNS